MYKTLRRQPLATGRFAEGEKVFHDPSRSFLEDVEKEVILKLLKLVDRDAHHSFAGALHISA